MLRLGVSHKAFTETYCTAAHCVLRVLLQAATERVGEHVSLCMLLSFSYPHGAFWIVTCFLFPWRVMESASLLVCLPFFFFFLTATAKRISNNLKLLMAKYAAISKGASGQRQEVTLSFQCLLKIWLDVRGWKQQDPAICRTLGAGPSGEANQLAGAAWVYDYGVVLKGQREPQGVAVPLKTSFILLTQ